MELLNQKTFRENMLKQFKGTGIPIEGVLELTGRCNLNCKMCYVHNQPNSYFAKGEKDGDWWISVIDEACNAGMLFALLSGGECMMHPDFHRIYLHLRSRGIYTRINTNGLLLNQGTIDFFKANPPLDIQLTLYGTDDISYEKVTGAKVFHQVFDAIMRLKQSGLSFHIAVTPNNYAPGETNKIIKFLKTINVSYQINSALFSPYSDTSDTTLSDVEINIDDKIQFLRNEMNEPGDEIDIDSLPLVGGEQTVPASGLKCNGGKVSFFITWDGGIEPCHAFYNHRMHLVSPSDFSTVWDEIKRYSQDYRLPVECEGCVYKKACLSCPVLRGGKVGNGHCDPAICDMTRRLVAAGVKKISF